MRTCAFGVQGADHDGLNWVPPPQICMLTSNHQHLRMGAYLEVGAWQMSLSSGVTTPGVRWGPNPIPWASLLNVGGGFGHRGVF